MFEIVFVDNKDRSKKVTVFWYIEMVDMAGEITSLQVYNTSVMVTAREEPQYLVEFKQSRNKNGFEYVVVSKGKIVREKYRYHWMSENELNV